MVQSFFVGVLFLTVSLGVMLVHYSYYDTQTIQHSVQNITTLTKGSFLSLSTAYYEPRVEIQTRSNPAYPEMQTINRMDFVYAK